jgi:hypothetical protein
MHRLPEDLLAWLAYEQHALTLARLGQFTLSIWAEK